MRDAWFPAQESQSVVGRVVEIEKVHPAKSREAGRAVNIYVPVMESKVRELTRPTLVTIF